MNTFWETWKADPVPLILGHTTIGSAFLRDATFLQVDSCIETKKIGLWHVANRTCTCASQRNPVLNTQLELVFRLWEHVYTTCYISLSSAMVIVCQRIWCYSTDNLDIVLYNLERKTLPKVSPPLQCLCMSWDRLFESKPLGLLTRLYSIYHILLCEK